MSFELCTEADFVKGKRCMTLWRNDDEIVYWIVGRIHSLDSRVLLNPCSIFSFQGHFKKEHDLELARVDRSGFIYKLASKQKKIQAAMELRALNLIIQRILGDPTFKYEYMV